ncbi:phage integrase SAM-like domain-containing protein [Bernardetia sp. OM2101]|uniref:site-specific integrase n=1 Tax=Bernardetia sp. OM2101 TaxID=3344876 RepID=UPI0035CEC2F4
MQKKRFMNVGFLIRKLRTERYSVSCRVSFGADDKGVPFSTGVIINKKENWKNKRGYNFTILNKEENAKVKTDTLLLIKSELEEIYLRLRTLKKPCCATTITNIYLEQEKPPLTIVFLVHQYVEEQLKRKLSSNTKSGYKRYRTDFENFCNQFKITHLPATEFTKVLAKDYFNFLKDKPNSEEIAGRKVRLIKTVLEEAYDNEVIDKNPLLKLSIKARKVKKNNVFLFTDELERIENKTFDIERLERIKDLFLFQCYTGFHYNQMKIFDSKKHLFTQNGKEWISFDRDKTMAYIGIPVLPKVKYILEKYNYKLPVLSNGNYNLYLKEIAVACHINKNLTTKVGRKTFANYMINVVKVSKDVVGRLLSHSSVTIRL